MNPITRSTASRIPSSDPLADLRSELLPEGVHVVASLADALPVDDFVETARQRGVTPPDQLLEKEVLYRADLVEMAPHSEKALLAFEEAWLRNQILVARSSFLSQNIGALLRDRLEELTAGTTDLDAIKRALAEMGLKVPADAHSLDELIEAASDELIQRLDYGTEFISEAQVDRTLKPGPLKELVKEAHALVMQRKTPAGERLSDGKALPPPYHGAVVSTNFEYLVTDGDRLRRFLPEGVEPLRRGLYYKVLLSINHYKNGESLETHEKSNLSYVNMCVFVPVKVQGRIGLFPLKLLENSETAYDLGVDPEQGLYYPKQVTDITLTSDPFRAKGNGGVQLFYRDPAYEPERPHRSHRLDALAEPRLKSRDVLKEVMDTVTAYKHIITQAPDGTLRVHEVSTNVDSLDDIMPVSTSRVVTEGPYFVPSFVEGLDVHAAPRLGLGVSIQSEGTMSKSRPFVDWNDSRPRGE